jgi:molybdopterin converting factor subunit 1
MEVEVRYFASLTEHTGATTESVDVEPSMAVGDLWDLLVGRHPGLAQVAYRPLVACDRVYAEWDRTLDKVREVAFLPPVSGG